MIDMTDSEKLEAVKQLSQLLTIVPVTIEHEPEKTT
jgi:hypothetical protein